jgi:MraZ protein
LRSFVSSAEECEFDNQGRILIPPMLRAEVGIGQEVVLAGVLTNFEIWDKATWEIQADQDKRDRQKIMEAIAGVGL